MIDDFGAWLCLDLIERRIAPWGYDIVARLDGRILIARGGLPPGGSGGRGRPRSGRPSPSRIRIPAILRSNVSKAATRSRRTSAAAERARETAAYYRRISKRAAEQAKAATALARQIEKEHRKSERIRKRELRVLANYLTPARSRTTYQRRVVSRATRRAEEQWRAGEPARRERAERRAEREHARQSETAALHQRYARLLGQEKGDRYEVEGGIEGNFLNLPFEQRQAIIDRALERNREWIENDKPNRLGYAPDTYIVYHFTAI